MEERVKPKRTKIGKFYRSDRGMMLEKQRYEELMEDVRSVEQLVLKFIISFI